MNISKKIKDIITRPNIFFKNLNNEKGIRDSLIFSLFLTLLYLLASLAVKFITIVSVEFNIAKYVLMIIVGWMFLFVYAAIAHVWIKLFGGKGNYSKTYQLIVYSGTPGYLYGWVPLVGGVISGIHSILLSIIALQEVHGLSKKRAILAAVLPFILITFVIFVLILIIASTKNL